MTKLIVNWHCLLTKYEVKMARYWPSSFFCVFIDQDGVEVHKLAKKKERGQYPAILTEQTWLIKDLWFGFWLNFSRGTRRLVASGQDSPLLPARVANHSERFGSSCPLTELAISEIESVYRVSIEFYKRFKTVCAFSLVDRYVKMRVCNHGCDVPLSVFPWHNLKPFQSR